MQFVVVVIVVVVFFSLSTLFEMTSLYSIEEKDRDLEKVKVTRNTFIANVYVCVVQVFT